MVRKFEIANLQCLCAESGSKDNIAYILYPMDNLADWVEPAAEKYGTTIVVITGMDWQNAMSPWPAKGVPKGSPDFEGKAAEFLELLRDKVVPDVEHTLGYDCEPCRSLVGVSMSGMFALWQWMVCDTFTDIASLSGSFWYEGFVEWMKSRQVPTKSGKAFFLLGNQEARSKVNAFDSVAQNTAEIISLLDSNNIKTEFLSVPGNHYSNPIPRLNQAFTALYSIPHPA